ncbi:anti-anti-sigma factor [Micromonospora pallida]|uniref:Anti-anti-sigma factor n=1 Tax=Micromonospora pallida TaxID=145854 RepID=A0A1C6S026_9ACTN|nr:STAS domain-containing protein [Micromonospora pallida]SCL22639.1 anti-anti-sigma factor [Micromonospora pallida]
MDSNGRGAEGVPGTDQAEITVTDPLDLAGVRRLGPVVDAVLARRPARLVIDMSACPHVDAAGIGLLLDTHRRMWRLGGLLTLRSPAPRIRRLLQVARVDQVFHVVSGPSGETATSASTAAPTTSAGETGAPASTATPPRARATAPVRPR